MTTASDVDDEWARVGAHLLAEDEVLAAAPPVDRITVQPPAPGTALLACRCGAVLDADDMHRSYGRWPGGQSIPAIVCQECAT